jgi:hypothetical protein
MVAWLIPARWKGEEATGPLEEEEERDTNGEGL